MITLLGYINILVNLAGRRFSLTCIQKWKRWMETYFCVDGDLAVYKSKFPSYLLDSTHYQSRHLTCWNKLISKHSNTSFLSYFLITGISMSRIFFKFSCFLHIPILENLVLLTLFTHTGFSSFSLWELQMQWVFSNLILRHTWCFSALLQGEETVFCGVRMTLMCVWIGRKTHGVEPLAAFNSCVRILWMIQIIVGVVAWNVLMALHVVVVSVLISEMILTTVVLVLKSVLDKTGALLQCVIMVDELLIHYSCLLYPILYTFAVLFVTINTPCLLNNSFRYLRNLYNRSL